jgi:hypothetical protein
VKALCAVPVLLLGARLPTTEALVNGEQGVVGESFMRENAARYHTLYVAARCVIVLLSVALGLLVWTFARRLYGSRAALVAVAVYATLPDVLAHAGLATMDLATGLGFLASSYLFWKFLGSGRWTDWAWSALAFGFTFLTRFSAALLVPGFVVLILLGTLGRWIARPARAWLGLLLLVPAVIVIVNVGYLGKTSFLPLSLPLFESEAFRGLGQIFPDVRLPLPDSFLAGLDHQLYQSQAGHAHTYLFGRVYPHSVAWYFPIAALVKWPIGFLGLLSARVVYEVVARRGVRRPGEAGCSCPCAVHALLFFATSTSGFGTCRFYRCRDLEWRVGGGASPGGRRCAAVGARAGDRDGDRGVARCCSGVETARTAPWPLSSFNAFAGGPGAISNRQRLNVDWGQGRRPEEMSRRGIQDHASPYHGTADPAIYGIDYVPYTGGAPIPTEWPRSAATAARLAAAHDDDDRRTRAVELICARWPRNRGCHRRDACSCFEAGRGERVPAPRRATLRGAATPTPTPTASAPEVSRSARRSRRR